MRKAVATCLLLATLAGCRANPAGVTHPTSVTASQYDRVFDAAVAALEARGFAIARTNHRFGLITSKPRTSRTLFEPFTSNNLTLRRAGQSTLRKLRRRVIVRLEPANATAAPRPAKDLSENAPTVATQPGPLYQLDVRVILEAQHHPTRRLIGATGRSLFFRLDDVPTEWQRRNIHWRYWQRIDRDRALEKRLIQAITRRAES